MDNKNLLLKTLFIAFVILLLSSCASENKEVISKAFDGNINIRISRDPRIIHPIFRPSASGREIFQYIYLSLADFHPESMELSPILIEKIPEGYLTDNDGEQWINYDIELRPEAKWSDGVQITNRDYLFTMHMILHPESAANSWRPYFSSLKKITLDPNDSKKFSVAFSSDYMLSKEAAVTTTILPAHIYDPENKIASLNISDLHSENYEEKDSSIFSTLKVINKSREDATGIVQSGPYSLTAYETNQYIILDRQENYWGNAFPNNPFLQCNASKITFKIVPDEQTAITMAKEGKIDLMMMSSSNAFLSLKEDVTFNNNWSFHVPQLMKYYYLAINNKSSVLSDSKVRSALAQLCDIDDYIENIEGGLGVRTTGTFHPTKDYYNEELPLVPYDITAAASQLDEAGWNKKDADGTRYKTINGSKQRLELDLLSTGSELSKNIGLIFQEAASKGGVKINLVTKSSSLMRKENIANYNYDLAMLVTGMDSAPDDPYRKWHSDNTKNGNNNTCGYSNSLADKYIEAVRLTRDEAKRKEHYLKLQEVMYEDQPAVFLYCPLNKIITSKKYKATTTGKRPGYLANTFKIAS